MKLEIGFGSSPQAVEIPDANVIGVLEPNVVEITEKGAEVVRRALQNPLGSPRLRQIVKPGERVVIIASDITRPAPSYKIIPPILEELWSADVNPDDVTVVFALGSHRKHTAEEMKKLVGEGVFAKVRCLDGDPDDFVHMGETAMGTPVDVTRIVAEADRRIGTGNIEYHYFAGYSGGAKAIMPGVSTRAAIQSNHSRMVLPSAVSGQLEDNPVRRDIEEAIKFCPVDFIVNVVLDEHKEIIYAVSGHYIEAHREGCRFLDRLYLKEIKERADIVLVSQGGAPKDINLYQTQKALDNAKHAVKKGGIVILAGSCKEGLGDETFEQWMLSADNPDVITERIQKEFRLGGHKAAAIALVLRDAEIYLVSEMEPEFVRGIFMEPFETVQNALDAAFAKLGPDASVLVMPYGGSTLPKIKNETLDVVGSK